ncbi:TMhelix containing protein [Vibrio phage 1.186.O._10N.286.49.E3]|nr:TMhelix containing protein [Vibrio phage 1.186.O._10N.286.49.E3]
MKKILKALGIFLISGVFLYLCASFVLLNYDMTEWTQAQRFFLLLFSTPLIPFVFED